MNKTFKIEMLLKLHQVHNFGDTSQLASKRTGKIILALN